MDLPIRLWLVNVVLRQFAAYRMQLFLYLKASGHPELGTSDCWMGKDADPATGM
jgi:hypothetical protein